MRHGFCRAPALFRLPILWLESRPFKKNRRGSLRRHPVPVAMNAPARNAELGPVETTAVATLAAISLAHFLNDMIQSLLPAIYPVLKDSFALDFTQIGVITLAFNFTASLLQPVVGLYTDRYPKPFSLTIGMGLTLCGLLVLAAAPTYPLLVLGAALVGLGSAVFHPESSRVARVASGGRYGLAQSVFQVGGNVGSSVGPLLAALIVVPYGQSSIAWFSVAALLGMIVLFNVGSWYRHRLPLAVPPRRAVVGGIELPHGKIATALLVLAVLVFSKFLYMASLTTFYTFYVIERFGVSVQTSQILLFVFLAAVAAGTVIGGPIGDRFGRKVVIWGSILGSLPFTLLLPYANLFWTVMLTVVIGVVLASAFSAIVVMGHALLPGRIGMVSGLFFGFAFGMSGIGAAALGILADATSIEFVFKVCSYLPAIGLITVFLPDIGASPRRPKPA
jgi:FSR family fosmidomycin resistance protein-like MFS transporter